jgi:hypothetical protein
MTIRHLNWDEVAHAQPLWRPRGWRLLALWPSPIDHDTCFAGAGFSDFEDSDDAWHARFSELVADVVRERAHHGEPRLVEGEQPRKKGRQTEPLRDALLAAASDDNFPACVVEFGSPRRALVRTSDGHPMLWIASSSDLHEELQAVAAKHGGARRLQLDWNKLA